MVLLPAPLWPTRAFTPGPSSIVVGSAYDLTFSSSTDRNCTALALRWRRPPARAAGGRKPGGTRPARLRLEPWPHALRAGRVATQQVGREGRGPLLARG